MAQRFRYTYACRVCGDNDEFLFADDSHRGDVATCASCLQPVALGRQDTDRSPFWFVGGEGSPSFAQTRSPDVFPAQWLSFLIDADKWFASGKVASAREAALPLCGWNPLAERADLSVHRTFPDWWRIAKSGGYEGPPALR